MTLQASDKEVIFKLPEAMKHPMEHDNTSYSIDDINLIICDCEQEMLALNPLEEYLNELDDSKVERKPWDEPPRKQQEKVVISLKKKTDGQEGPPWKIAWKTVSENNNCTKDYGERGKTHIHDLSRRV